MFTNLVVKKETTNQHKDVALSSLWNLSQTFITSMVHEIPSSREKYLWGVGKRVLASCSYFMTIYKHKSVN